MTVFRFDEALISAVFTVVLLMVTNDASGYYFGDNEVIMVSPLTNRVVDEDIKLQQVGTPATDITLEYLANKVVDNTLDSGKWKEQLAAFMRKTSLVGVDFNNKGYAAELESLVEAADNYRKILSLADRKNCVKTSKKGVSAKDVFNICATGLVNALGQAAKGGR